MIQSHPTATPWPRSSLPGTCARPWPAQAGKSHHRGRSLRPLASQLGLPTPTAPDTAASAVVTHCEGGGLRQTCWASSCPAASQCPRRGGTWVGHNGTSPPTSGSLVQPGCFFCPELPLSSCALKSRKQSCDRDTRVHTNPAPLQGHWKAVEKYFKTNACFSPQMFIVVLLPALAGVVGRHWSVSRSPQPRRACRIRPALGQSPSFCFHHCLPGYQRSQ